MTLALAERSRTGILSALAARLNTGSSDEALKRALVAEHLRAATYFASAHTSSTDALPLPHTNRLMAHLRRNLDGLWPLRAAENPTNVMENFGNSYTTVLGDLKTIGDLVGIGGGYWISAPLRFVEGSDPETLLVFGGAPCEVVRAATGAMVSCAAATRFVRRIDLKNHAAFRLIQSLDAWMGFSDPLPLWTKRTIAAHLERLSASEEMAADQLEVYAPDFYRDRKKHGRWMPATEINRSIDGPRLCRPRAAHAPVYARPHYLGVFSFRQGRLVLLRSAPVEFETSRRLKFGIDDTLNETRSATITLSGDTCIVDLPYRLPQPEVRVLSLGWRTSPPGATNDAFAIPRAALPALDRALRRLLIVPIVSTRGAA
jgi:hypothetical protein